LIKLLVRDWFVTEWNPFGSLGVFASTVKNLSLTQNACNIPQKQKRGSVQEREHQATKQDRRKETAIDGKLYLGKRKNTAKENTNAEGSASNGSPARHIHSK